MGCTCRRLMAKAVAMPMAMRNEPRTLTLTRATRCPAQHARATHKRWRARAKFCPKTPRRKAAPKKKEDLRVAPLELLRLRAALRDALLHLGWAVLKMTTRGGSGYGHFSSCQPTYPFVQSTLKISDNLVFTGKVCNTPDCRQLIFLEFPTILARFREIL